MTLEPPGSAPAAAAAAPAPTSPSSPLPVVHFSYDQIHQQIVDAIEGPRAIFSAWRPTLLLCISGGGLVPTRILRSCLRRVSQREAAAQSKDPSSVPNVPVQCVGLQLYDTEGLDPETSAPVRTQWLRHDPQAAARQAIADWEEAQKRGGRADALPSSSSAPPSQPRPLVLQGQRVLVVDEVDDSRATLAACCAELEADAARERDAYEALVSAYRQSNANAASAPPPWAGFQIGVFVVHNKRRPKRGVLSDDIIMSGRYFAASYLPNCWCRYPWDADDIAAHAEAARRQHAAVRVLPAAEAAAAERQEQREQRARRRTDAAAPEILLA